MNSNNFLARGFRERQPSNLGLGSDADLFSQSGTVPGVMRQQYSPNVNSLALPDQSFATVPIRYPESSQRTRLRDGRFPSSEEGLMSAQNTHSRSTRDDNILFSGPQFSSGPIPSDRPPPPLHPPGPAPPSFPHPRTVFPPIYSPPNSYAQSSSFLNPTGRTLNPYRESSTVTDYDEEAHPTSNQHHPSNFIPIVPQTSTYSVSYAGTGPPLSFNGSEGSAPSSPRLSPSPEYDPSPPPPSLEPFLSHAPLDEARHRKSGSPKLPPKMHPCHICFKQFPRPSGLKTHMNSHTNTRPYTCGFHNCSKTFSVRSNAKRHYRTHGGTAPPPGAAPAFSVNFEEPNIAPSQPQPPPAALSRAPYRVRFLEPNRLARTRTGGPNPAQSDIELREGQGQGNDHDHEYKQTDYDFADVQPTTTTATYYQNSWNAYAPG